MAFEENLYCDYTPGAAKAVAGKDVILAVFNANWGQTISGCGPTRSNCKPF